MALKTIVKISNVTNLSDARYCAGMGVELMGFNVDPQSDDYIDHIKFRQIIDWIEGVKFVAEMHDDLVYYPKYEVDYVEVMDPKLAERAKQICDKVILKFKLDEEMYFSDVEPIFKQYLPQVDYFLIESNSNDHLAQDQKRIIGDLAESFPILLGYGITIR